MFPSLSCTQPRLRWSSLQCALWNTCRWIWSKVNSHTAAILQTILEWTEMIAKQIKERNLQHNIWHSQSQSNAIYILDWPQQITAVERSRKQCRHVQNSVGTCNSVPHWKGNISLLLVHPDTQIWSANRIPVPNGLARILLGPFRRMLTDRAGVTVTHTCILKRQVSNPDTIRAHVYYDRDLSLSSLYRQMP